MDKDFQELKECVLDLISHCNFVPKKLPTCLLEDKDFMYELFKKELEDVNKHLDHYDYRSDLNIGGRMSPKLFHDKDFAIKLFDLMYVSMCNFKLFI